MTANLTTRDLLEDGAHTLAGSSDTAQLDAELLLAHLLHTHRVRLRSHGEDARSEGERVDYRALLARRLRGEPVAYIVGYKDFWSLRLAVTPAVLVPRPESELLVEQALAVHPAATGSLLDLGTGSGALALALAHERPQWQVTASDLCEEALAVARANARSLKLERVEFLHGNRFEPVGTRRFDVIVSNPPYVSADDPALSQAALCHEPRLALTPGRDAMLELRAIVRAAPQHLERGGWLLLEHGAAQASDVARELVVRGFRHVRSHRDLAGHERMSGGQWA